jgi:selenocysteine-specific translation elongation factor
MGRPLNKRNFSANANDNIKVQFNNGSASVPGYIVKQKGSKKFVVKAYNSATEFTCQLVDKASAALLAGEMSITVKLDDTTVEQVTKISAHRITAAGVSYPWNYSTSTSDGAAQIEEAGTSTANVAAGSTNLEGDAA